MVDRQNLSKGEMAVARTLWEAGPATVRKIHEIMTASQPIQMATVQTYLRRLESKGHANSKLDGRIRVYSARTKPHTVIRDSVREIVDNLFGGDSLPLVRHLIEDRGIDEAGLEELRQLIDRMDRTGGNKS
jgi:predicted transcriptional regulator